MARTGQVVLIAMDAAEKDLVLDWAEQGILPNIGAMLHQGLWGIADNPPGLSGATWPSVYTGCPVTQHGHYFYNRIIPGTYTTEIKAEGDYWRPSFWSVASRAGKRVAIVDMPKTLLEPDLNGIQLINWATHDPDAFEAFDATPASLKQQVLADYPGDPMGRNDWGGTGPSDFRRLRDGYLANIERRTRLVEDFLDRDDWDLFAVCFDDSHQVGHLCWHIADAAHPQHDAALAASLGNPIRDVYVAIDAAIGRILGRIGPDTTVVLLAPMGMGPNYHATHLLDPLMRKMDGTSTKRGSLYHFLSWGWRQLPLMFHKPLWDLQIQLRERLMGPDRARRRCFVLPTNEDCGAIRINLAGREPQGLVQPGAEFDRLCADLEREIMAMVDRETGRPLAKRVHRAADLFDGGCHDHLPDLIVEWNVDVPFSVATSRTHGGLGQAYRGARTGSHQRQGFFAVTGPGIAAGELERAVPATDIAPTILSLIGLPMPDAAGQPIPEVVNR